MPSPNNPPKGGLEALLRALLLASERPLTVREVVDLVAQAVADEEWPALVTPEEVEATFTTLATAFVDSGIVLGRAGDGWRLRTAPDLGLMVRRLWPERAARLSRAALEVLAIVAYRQPCTRAEVEEVRGVDCGTLLKTLLERRLLTMVGRKDEPGRPLLYGTTPFFLETFALPDLRALPTLRDLAAMEAEELARAKGSAPLRRAEVPETPEETREETEEKTREDAPDEDG